MIINEEYLNEYVTDLVNNKIDLFLSNFNQKESDEEKTSVLLTRGEAASYLKVSLVTLNSWSKKGVLNSYKIGTRVRYKKDDLLHFLRK